MTAALYTRVSTIEQADEGYSLDAQRKALESWAKQKGYDSCILYSDAGISAKDIKHRPQMKQMLADAESGKFNAVLVWSLSRLTRSVSDLYQTWGKLSRRNIGLLSYTEAFDTSTSTGRAMMGLLGVFAQMEREITAERVKAALEERAAQGKRTCSDVLGYNLTQEGLAVNKDEADRVRYIYDSYLSGETLSDIARGCESRGYHGKRGRHFKAWHIHVILTRPIYAGFNSFCGKAYRGNHEPIISPEVWAETQRQIKLRSRKCRRQAAVISGRALTAKEQ